MQLHDMGEQGRLFEEEGYAILGGREEMQKLAFALHQFKTLAPELCDLLRQLDVKFVGTPRNTLDAIAPCGHRRWEKTPHCAEMSCSNYIAKHR